MATKQQYESMARFHARMAEAFDANGQHQQAQRAREAMTHAIAMAVACESVKD